MTTHNVQIRRKNGDGGPTWFTLTRSPISKRDADNLVTILGDAWEGRVVALESPLGEEFAELERLMPNVKRWERIRLSHHPECDASHSEEKWITRPWGEIQDVMTGAQWIALRDIDAAIARMRGSQLETCRITRDDAPLSHDGHCPACGALARALSVRVTIAIGNKSTVREYAL